MNKKYLQRFWSNQRVIEITFKINWMLNYFWMYDSKRKTRLFFGKEVSTIGNSWFQIVEIIMEHFKVKASTKTSMRVANNIILILKQPIQLILQPYRYWIPKIIFTMSSFSCAFCSYHDNYIADNSNSLKVNLIYCYINGNLLKLWLAV